MNAIFFHHSAQVNWHFSRSQPSTISLDRVFKKFVEIIHITHTHTCDLQVPCITLNSLFYFYMSFLKYPTEKYPDASNFPPCS